MEASCYENLPESFVYTPDQSRVLSFGIDYPTPGTGGAAIRAPRNQQAEKDATSAASTIRDRMIGEHSNLVQVYAVSRDNDMCTAAGMEKAFKAELGKVGEHGMFIFRFVGSATAVSGQYSLNSADFDAANPATYITSQTLIKWMSSVVKSGYNLPKYVLFVFNCPFANYFAEEMAKEENYRDIGCKISVCSLGVTPGLDTPSGLIFDTLEHSIFGFFFDHFLRRASRSVEGNFILKDAFVKINKCCDALSSLLVTYRNGVLKSNIMESTAAYLNRGNRTEIDSSNVGRFDFLAKNVTPGDREHAVILSSKVDAFLDWVSEYNAGALWTLKRNGALDDSSVLTAAFCIMMMSIASFQVVEDETSLQKPTLFYQAFMQVASTIERVYKHREAAEDDTQHAEIQYVQLFRKSVDFYLQVLKENKVDDRKFQEFLRKVNADIAHIA